jgi:hypothetical protein
VKATLRLSGQLLRIAGYAMLSSALFALHSSIAIAAGYFLLQLPEIWTQHIEDGPNSGVYTVLAVGFFALLAGVLCLVFTFCVVETLSGAAASAVAGKARRRQVVEDGSTRVGASTVGKMPVPYYSRHR